MISRPWPAKRGRGGGEERENLISKRTSEQTNVAEGSRHLVEIASLGGRIAATALGLEGLKQIDELRRRSWKRGRREVAENLRNWEIEWLGPGDFIKPEPVASRRRRRRRPPSGRADGRAVWRGAEKTAEDERRRVVSGLAREGPERDEEREERRGEPCSACWSGERRVPPASPADRDVLVRRGAAVGDCDDDGGWPRVGGSLSVASAACGRHVAVVVVVVVSMGLEYDISPAPRTRNCRVERRPASSLRSCSASRSAWARLSCCSRRRRSSETARSRSAAPMRSRMLASSPS